MDLHDVDLIAGIITNDPDVSNEESKWQPVSCDNRYLGDD